MLTRVTISLIALTVLSGTALAHHKPGHHMPPGQAKKMERATRVIPPDVQVVVPAQVQVVVPDQMQFVCLITTEVPGDPYAGVVSSYWLPRAEAEAEANLGDSFIIYHPDFNTEDGCLSI